MREKSEILKKFQKKYKHHINKGLSFHTLTWIRDISTFDFDVFLKTKDKNLQRPLVWTHQQKESLIYTLLRDQPINPIIVVQVCERSNQSDYLFKVIDGKQRLTTAFDFMDNKFSIDIDGKPYFYKDLPEDAQREINGYNFKWDVHYDYPDKKIDDNTLIDIFEECNFLGTPQDKNHLDNLRL